MSRNFPDFLSAYFAFSRDSFSPDSFHKWTGISVLAGALERRVWINQAGRMTYPNLYVFLISNPGEGKSSAGNVGVLRLLRKVRRNGMKVSFLPDQMTEAAFIETMKGSNSFLHKVGTSDGQWRTHEVHQCAHYLYASEASNSLKELAGGGEITASLTAFYDCEDEWKKRTKGGGETDLLNVCCNILVGCTFSHMSELFPPSRILGGFASRIVYIASKERQGREIEWEPRARSADVEVKLLADLERIFSLSGQFTVTHEFAEAYVAFFRECDAHRRALRDERLQAFLARRHTNMLKLSMICAVSESDSLVLEMRHWERALSLLPEIDHSLDLVIDAAADPTTQAGVNHIIIGFIKRSGSRTSASRLRRYIIDMGISRDVLFMTLHQLLEAGLLAIEGADYVIRTYPEDNLAPANNVLDMKEEAVVG